MPSFLSQTLIYTLFGINKRSHAFFFVPNLSLHPLGLIGDPMPSFLSQTLVYTFWD